MSRPSVQAWLVSVLFGEGVLWLLSIVLQTSGLLGLSSVSEVVCCCLTSALLCYVSCTMRIPRRKHKNKKQLWDRPRRSDELGHDSGIRMEKQSSNPQRLEIELVRSQGKVVPLSEKSMCLPSRRLLQAPSKSPFSGPCNYQTILSKAQMFINLLSAKSGFTTHPHPTCRKTMQHQ